MSNLADRLYAQARITPVQSQSRVKSINKLADGSLEVTQHGGNVFIVTPDDVLFQAFLVWTVLNPDA